MKLHYREQSIEEAIDAVGDFGEVLGSIPEFAVIAVDNDEFAIVVLYPFFIEALQALQVIEANGLLIFTATLLNLSHQRRDA